ncbi:ABC transporter permease [Brucella sp. BE17]|uniref:ABC transporter permease n=1 Tax=Brucella sp. BE17 TaxID=3142977 RepID=UPI0031BA2A7E
MTCPSARTTRWIIVALLIAAWEVLPGMGLIPTLFLPPLSLTLQALYGELGEYWSQLLVTLQEVGVALIFACGGGISCGILLGSSVKSRKLFLPMVSAAYAVPLVVLYPLFTAWFGIGMQSKIVFASVYGFLPTMLGAAAGVQTIDKNLMTTARSMGASKRQQILRVLVPATMPTVLSSLRIGGALVIVGVVVAEMLMSTAGVGFLISRYRTMLDSPRVFAAILLVLFLAILFDLIVQAAERQIAGWKNASSKAAA